MKQLRADLHIHTTYSDGTFTVSEVMEEAQRQNLTHIAITDHDCLDGAIEAKSLEDKYDLNIIYGIELSSYYNDESIHVLGYFKNLEGCEKLKSYLDGVKESRYKRAIKIKELLEEHFNIVLDEKKLLDGNRITRGHIARVIKASGYNYTNEQIFKTMIGDGCKAYIPASKLHTSRAIKMLKEAGALVVLAHPVIIKKSEVTEILDLGFDGIEAIYPVNTQNDTVRFRGLAKQYKLFVTCGNDFHTPNDYNHGHIGGLYLSGEELNVFLRKLK